MLMWQHICPLQAVNPNLTAAQQQQAAQAALYYTQLAAAGGYSAPPQEQVRSLCAFVCEVRACMCVCVKCVHRTSR